MKTLEGKVNAELRKLCDLLIANKLTVNTRKSNFVLFHPHQKRATYFPKLYIFDSQKNGNVTFESKDYVAYIGGLLDKNLSWKFHIDTIASKISKTVGLTAKLRHFISRCILLNICQFLIYSYLTYRLASWGKSLEMYLRIKFKFFKEEPFK